MNLPQAKFCVFTTSIGNIITEGQIKGASNLILRPVQSESWNSLRVVKTTVEIIITD